MLSWVQLCCGLWRFSLKVINKNGAQACCSPPRLERGDWHIYRSWKCVFIHLRRVYATLGPHLSVAQMSSGGVGKSPAACCGSPQTWLLISLRIYSRNEWMELLTIISEVKEESLQDYWSTSQCNHYKTVILIKMFLIKVGVNINHLLFSLLETSTCLSEANPFNK